MKLAPEIPISRGQTTEQRWRKGSLYSPIRCPRQRRMPRSGDGEYLAAGYCFTKLSRKSATTLLIRCFNSYQLYICTS